MWHFRQSNNFWLVCVLILSAGFMLQFKVLYENHRKHLRIKEISETMAELATGLKRVETLSNSSSLLMNKLQKRLRNSKPRLKRTR